MHSLTHNWNCLLGATKQFAWPKNKERRLVTIGVSGVIISVICGVGFYAISLPMSGTADSKHHLDYSWRVSRGQLPRFKDGLRTPVLAKRPVRVHFTSQHPPLYYAINAPIVGTLLNSGHLTAATLAARAINIILAVGVVIALAWAGWVLAGKQRQALYAVAVPAMMASVLLFVKVAGDVMNDVLTILVVTLALVVSCLIIKHGFKRPYIIGLILICVLGMASRASFITTLLLAGLAIIARGIIDKKPRKNIMIGVLLASCVVIVSLASMSWFYARNYDQSGSVLRSGKYGTIAKLQKRTYKPISRVLQSRETWLGLPGSLYGNPWKGWPKIARYPFNHTLSLAVFTLLIVSAVAWAVRSRWWQRITINDKVIVGILGLHVVAMFAQLILYSKGYGAINPRYLLPIWLPLGMVLATGALAPRKLRGMGVIVFASLCWLAVIINAMWFSSQRFTTTTSNPLGALIDNITVRNHIPIIVVPVLLVGLVFGVTLQAIALWRISHQKVSR